MATAIRFSEFGGPEVLRWEEVTVGEPGPGEARIRQMACGLNFIDIYQRTGLYKVALPSALGLEGAGVVEAVGAGVTSVKPGNRVAYAGGPVGAYATERLIPADRLCILPEGLTFEQGAAMMLKGLTVQYLIRRTYRVQPDDTVLFHAAAGGVGLIACQWLKALGATVIGTAGSDEKCLLARQHGADHSINYRTENFVERVREITGGAGVPVVYDSVGKETFMGSLQCLRPFGLMVSFGNASGRFPRSTLLQCSILCSLTAEPPDGENGYAVQARFQRTLCHRPVDLRLVESDFQRSSEPVLEFDGRRERYPVNAPVVAIDHLVPVFGQFPGHQPGGVEPDRFPLPLPVHPHQFPVRLTAPGRFPLDDPAHCLPPLKSSLCRDLVERTGIGNLLGRDDDGQAVAAGKSLHHGGAEGGEDDKVRPVRFLENKVAATAAAPRG